MVILYLDCEVEMCSFIMKFSVPMLNSAAFKSVLHLYFLIAIQTFPSSVTFESVFLLLSGRINVY